MKNYFITMRVILGDGTPSSFEYFVITAPDLEFAKRTARCIAKDLRTYKKYISVEVKTVGELDPDEYERRYELILGD